MSHDSDFDNQPTMDGPGPPSNTAGAIPLPDRYQDVEKIGEGGMGIVVKARDRETGELVAVKVLRPEIASDAAALERFKNELRLARKITHKNVCRIHEFHRTETAACISMEYVDGESLRRLLAPADGLSIRYALQVMSQILAGMAEAHTQGVFHRDLKPENIMIARDGTAKIMDFGIARAAESQATRLGSISGTPAYMSPEQAEGKTADARSDIYSLGLVMYEMFTGRQAFSAETPMGMAYQQVHATAPPPRQYEPDLPGRIERAIEKCLQKDPENRFASVAELETTLSEERAPETAPEPVEEADPVPPAYLEHRTILDAALLFLGMIGMIYFLIARDSVSPVSSIKLEVDAITARRTVADVAKRLGLEYPETTRILLQFRGYHRVVWRLERVQSFLRVKWPFLSQAEVTNTGRFERLQTESPDFPNNYQSHSLQERRGIATQAVETACGSLPSNYRIEETSGGERGSSYKAGWFSLDGSREVSLVAEKLTKVDCNVHPPRRSPFWANSGWLIGIPFALFLMAVFFLRRSFRLPAAMRRAPLAILLGLIAAWMVYPSLAGDQTVADRFSGQTPAFIFPWIAAPAFGGLIWMGLLATEHSLRRRSPHLVASYILALQAKLMEPSVVFAVLRGASCGLILIGFETLAANRGHILADQEPLEQAIQSFSPSLYALAAAILDGVLIGVIFLGFQSTRAKSKRRWTQWLDRFVGIPLAWWITGFHLRLSEFVSLFFAPFLIFFPEAVFLAWLLQRYDVLTVIFAVFTAVLWIVNYPLMQVFSEVGNGAHVALFGGWGALVIFAAMFADRENVQRLWRRLRTAD